MSQTTNAGCTIYKPPVRPKVDKPSVFLAGSIEMGVAKNWQKELASALERLPVMIFNPRRDDWNKDWKQDISNPPFKDQVLWEMEYLDRVDVIALFFQPGTMSPISLLELGLLVKEKKLIVCCPEGFWRRGNVQVICERFKIPLVENIEELAEQVKGRLVDLLQKEPAMVENS